MGRSLPIGGIVLALATGGVLVLAGMSPLLVAGTITIWIATFWLVLPPAPQPAAEPRQAESVQLTRTGMRDLIEHSGLPVLMLDGMRIIVANAAAREAIGTHVQGQDARIAFRHPAAVDLLSRKDGGSTDVQGLTGPRSSWQMRRQPIDDRYCLIELVNRTSEADVSRAHTDFVANASHELRTPLASIIGYMETLAEGGEAIDPTRTARFHTIVLREARRLQHLVDDLMSLSRVEAEKHDRPREQVDLAQLISQAARDGAGPERQERLAIAREEGRVLVRGDYRQLEQLVRNLVDNALKYGSPGTTVDVHLARDERDMAVISVRDRGEGIAPEHIPHLTRRFYRTAPGRSRTAGGTGLGLAIVKHIVERHRGRLDITSRQGDGTTVTVRIPLVEEQPNLAEAADTPDAVS